MIGIPYVKSCGLLSFFTGSYVVGNSYLFGGIVYLSSFLLFFIALIFFIKKYGQFEGGILKIIGISIINYFVFPILSILLVTSSGIFTIPLEAEPFVVFIPYITVLYFGLKFENIFVNFNRKRIFFIFLIVVVISLIVTFINLPELFAGLFVCFEVW